MKKKTSIILLCGILFSLIIFSSIDKNLPLLRCNEELPTNPIPAGNLEGAENVIITAIDRIGDVSVYGMVNIEDRITIQNNNYFAIDSILVGIPLMHLDDLIYYKTYGEAGNSLVVEKKNIMINDYEMLKIYFDTPLLPYQFTEITFFHSYKNLFTYKLTNGAQLLVNLNLTFTIWPILPYRAEGDIHTLYKVPNSVTDIHFEKIGDSGSFDDDEGYSWDLSESNMYDYLDPFLTNLQDTDTDKNGGEYISFVFQDSELSPTEIHIEELVRNIKISPWGLIEVEEKFQVHNTGLIEQAQIFINIPINAKNVRVFDELGDLDIEFGAEMLDTTRLTIRLVPRRALLTPSSKVDLTISYNMLPENNFFNNWLQQSIKIDLITTQFEFLIKGETINFIIEGCGSINYISSMPNSIKHSGNAKILTYYSDYVSPIENKVILVTYWIDLFDLLFRPIIIILFIAGALSSFILLSKTKKPEESISLFKKEFLPINEIREFCSLYEEKNALSLEIRRAEDEAKRKKMAKKTFKNILEKNSSKIEQIKQEMQVFKKVLTETNETFNTMVKKLDLLDAERLSVDDSLNLLENRYKKGKLPSKAAYEKLAIDFLNRRKKIDRTIDRYIQQLRSYLL